MHPAVGRALFPIGVERLSRRAYAAVGGGVVLKALRPEFAFLFGRALVVQRIGLRLVLVLIGKSFVTLAHIVVGDERIDQMIQFGFEAAGQKLFGQVNSEKTRAGVDEFVTGHYVLQNIVSFFDLDT